MNETKFYEMRTALQELRKQNVNPHSFAVGYLGRCARCDTGGPCRAETASTSAEYDFSPGDSCIDRPFATEEIAVAYLYDTWFCTGGEIVSYWEGAEVRFVHRKLVRCDTYPSSGWLQAVNELKYETRGNQWALERAIERLNDALSAMKAMKASSEAS